MSNLLEHLYVLVEIQRKLLYFKHFAVPNNCTALGIILGGGWLLEVQSVEEIWRGYNRFSIRSETKLRASTNVHNTSTVTKTLGIGQERQATTMPTSTATKIVIVQFATSKAHPTSSVRAAPLDISRAILFPAEQVTESRAFCERIVTTRNPCLYATSLSSGHRERGGWGGSSKVAVLTQIKQHLTPMEEIRDLLALLNYTFAQISEQRSCPKICLEVLLIKRAQSLTKLRR
ncbi:hypothetical protein WH47_00954 [Habropoda laboriosa]|uniref:Uncharacterized protein n=1 Tax=Habropoda laboriosa TaxID=597456 RepID=A0A0L7R7B2_9HYME|nr:hypothetical protein WH47_00954 [Habropoda laboriosa]